MEGLGCLEALLHNNTTTLWGVCTHSCEAGLIVHPRAQLERLQSEGDQLQPKFFQQQNTIDTIDGGTSYHTSILTPPSSPWTGAWKQLPLPRSSLIWHWGAHTPLVWPAAWYQTEKPKTNEDGFVFFGQVFFSGDLSWRTCLCSALLQPTEICSLERTEAELALYDS